VCEDLARITLLCFGVFGGNGRGDQEGDRGIRLFGQRAIRLKLRRVKDACKQVDPVPC